MIGGSEITTLAERHRILLISSVVPNEASMGGSLILKRHFDNPRLDCRVFRPSREDFRTRLLRKFDNKYLRSFVRVINSYIPPRLEEKEMEYAIDEFRPDVILSVVHGWNYLSAARVATRRGIPLILWCQDWWPDFPDVSPLACKYVGRRLVKVCREAQGVVCVSDGMQSELGRMPNSIVIHDLPSEIPSSNRKRRLEEPYKLIYAGNVWDYGPMVAAAAVELSRVDCLHLDIFGGPRPNWGADVAEKFRVEEIYHGLVTPAELISRARNCDAGLVVMSFDSNLQKRMRTSFPSKLIEMAQLHMPLVIWGPEYCSAVQWARKRNSALCVTDPSPRTLRGELELLAASESEQRRLSLAAADAANNEFNPDRIRREFVSILERAKRSAGPV